MDRIKIDGKIAEVEKVFEGGYLPLLELSDGTEYYVAEDGEAAGAAARRYWQEMMDRNPAEFAALLGTERVVAWATGQSDSYGFHSAGDFLDAVERVPEEEFAGYDHAEVSVDRCGRLARELGFTPTVAYRHN